MVIGAAPASALTTLTTGTGDGQVTVTVDSRGFFQTALYNPVGTGGAADAVASSYTFFRAGGTGAATLLLEDGAFLTTSATSATSVFTLDSFTITLTQTVSNLLDANNVQTGSRLTQAYTILNNGAATTLDLARYIDGDLIFQSGRFTDDGGGRIAGPNGSTLFETDLATGANDQASFVGIDVAGGTNERFEIDEYAGLSNRLGAGTALRNTITGDANVDGFIDAGPGYDVALALSRNFTVGTGQSVTFTTGTIFGTGTPATAAVGVPEPATWGLMLLGMGMVGAGLRSRRRSVTFTNA
jgi:hypothetical protein